MLPGRYSSCLKRNGPEPVVSVSCFFGSVCATRSGMMKGTGEIGCASVWISSGKARLKRKRMRRSLRADSSSRCAFSVCPIGATCIQRSRLATQSWARTGAPSWNSSPARSVMVHCFAVVLEQVALGQLRLRLELAVHAV